MSEITLNISKEKKSENVITVPAVDKHISLDNELIYNLADLCVTAQAAAYLIDEGFINHDKAYIKDYSQMDLFEQLEVQKLLNDLFYYSSIIQISIPEIIASCGNTEEQIEYTLQICEDEYINIEKQMESIDDD